MSWKFALECLLGAAAVALVLGARRISRYSVGLWRVVASVEPRRRETHDSSTNATGESVQTHRETATDDNHVDGAQ